MQDSFWEIWRRNRKEVWRRNRSRLNQEVWNSSNTTLTGTY
jgi:hypothetical protein